MDRCDGSWTSSGRRPSTSAAGRYDKNLKCLEDESELMNAADDVGDATPQIPPNLETISRLEHLPSQRHRWNTNEEIAGILINFPRHDRWLTSDVRTRPFSGSLLLYSRKKVRYRRDGYCWKKRRDGKTTREDHMKLKVQGIECIYGCYVHSAILPTFHRRCYWLLQNPDIVLVHYLNVPFPDDNKVVLASTLPLWAESKQWSREELCLQLRPMFSTDASGYSTETGVYSDTVLATVDVIVDQLLERQKLLHSSSSEQQLAIGSAAPPPVQYCCGCSDASCQPGTVCPNPVRRGSSDTVIRQQHQQAATASSTSAPANVNSAPQPPLLINVQRVGSGAGSYLLVHNGTLSSSSSPPTAAAAGSESNSCTPLDAPSTTTPTAVGWPPTSGVSHDLFRGAFDLSLDDIQLTLSGSLTTSDMELNGSDQPCGSAAAHPEDVSLLDAFDGLDNFDFKSLDVGRSSCSSPDSSESPDNRIQRTMEDVLPASSVVAAILPECADPPAAAGSASQATVQQLQLVVASRPAADESEEDVDAGLSSPVKLEAQGALPQDRHTAVQQRHTQQQSSCRETTACISDFSPEWAYPEGGIKVLVAGPWYARSAPYIVLFDGVSVSTTFVQSGVLRCYCPAHEVGLVSLQVACDGLVISNACLFEYKRFPSEEAMADCSVPFPVQDDVLVKFTLMQRVRLMESQIDGATSSQASDPLASLCSADLEERLIGYCHTLMTRTWVSQSFSDLSMDSPSILHLAALLGYHRLVCALFRWRTENPFLCLEAEVDAVRTDASGDTPLSLACHRGHMETARLLYQWNHAALRLRNVAGNTPVDVARESGHSQLADELQRLDATRQQARELERNERAAAAAVFARPTAKHRSELWRQRNFSLDLSSCSSSSAADVSSGAAASSCSRQPRSCTPSPQRSAATTAVGATSRRTPSTARSSVDSGLDTLRGERSSSVPTAAAAASPACGSDTGCSSSTSLLSSDPAVDQQQHVLTLAEHIIAAIPERIKIESDNYQWDHGSSPMSDLASLRSETAMDESFEPLDITDFSYRCRDVNTPLSSVPSPASSSCLASPRSFSVSLDSPSPPPSAADLGQYFQASRRDVMLDFSNLTLSDREQRELYEAAIVIQKAYRIYKGRKLAEEQDREKQAAIVIQNGYRRYKQYCYYTQMTRAAMVIQTRYRSYCEHKRFKKSQEAAVCIQNYYRQYREHASKNRLAAQCAEASSSTGSAVGLKRTYSQRRQHLAAMKIQQFMRQSRNKLQRERGSAAENARPQPARAAQAFIPPRFQLRPPDVSSAAPPNT